MRDKKLAAIAITFGIITFFITVFRLFFGVDFTDEAFSSVLPYRFVLGAKPFVDELAFHQTSALITYPFVKLFYLITGSPTGIVLFMRFLWLFFMIGIAAVVWQASRKMLGNALALLVALPCVAFMYGNIPSLSYNTLGLGFLTAGSFLGFWAVSEDRRRWLPIAGVLHGLAVVAYPSLVIGVLAYLIATLLITKKVSASIQYASGGLVVAAGLGFAFFLFGFSNVLSAYQATSSAGIFGGGTAKFLMIFKSILAVFLGKPYLFIIIIGACLAIWASYGLRKTHPAVNGAFLTIVPLLIAVILLFAFPSVGFYGFYYSIGYIALFSLLAPYLYFFVRHNKEARRMFWLVWTPGLVAGIAVAYTSSIGVRAVTIGLFQGALVSLVFLCLTLDDIWRNRQRISKILPLLALIAPVIVLLFFQYSLPYRDAPIAKLTAHVTTGAYAGLYTTPNNRNYLRVIEKDLKNVEPGAKTVLFFNDFPAGYLLSDLTPLTDWAWISPMARYPGVDRNLTVEYFKKQKSYPDLIVRMNRVIYKAGYSDISWSGKNDPINNLAESPVYEPVVKRQDYAIFRLRHSLLSISVFIEAPLYL
jgi:hypothetical protein